MRLRAALGGAGWASRSGRPRPALADAGARPAGPPGRRGPAAVRSVYSAGHDPRLRRAPSRTTSRSRAAASSRSLRELGQNVTIITVFSGNGVGRRPHAYQREALGFGTKAIWPVTEAFNRSNIAQRLVAGPSPRRRRPGRPTPDASTPPRPTPTPRPSASGSAPRGTAGPTSTTGRSAGQPLIDDEPHAGRGPDRRARRGGGRGRRHGRPPARGRAVRVLRRGVDRLPRPARRGVPRLRRRRPAARRCRAPTTAPGRAARAARSSGSSRRRSTSRSASATTSTTSCAARSAWPCSRKADAGSCPGPEYAGIVAFYEDFPYAWWNDFNRLEDLPGRRARRRCRRTSRSSPEYADITDQLERKITGITLYASQIDRLFGTPKRWPTRCAASAERRRARRRRGPPSGTGRRQGRSASRRRRDGVGGAESRAACPRGRQPASLRRWMRTSRRAPMRGLAAMRIGLAGGLVAAAILRLALLPGSGPARGHGPLRGWVHRLATGLPLGEAYRLDLAFPR